MFQTTNQQNRGAGDWYTIGIIIYLLLKENCYTPLSMNQPTNSEWEKDVYGSYIPW